MSNETTPTTTTLETQLNDEAALMKRLEDAQKAHSAAVAKLNRGHERELNAASIDNAVTSRVRDQEAARTAETAVDICTQALAVKREAVAQERARVTAEENKVEAARLAEKAQKLEKKLKDAFACFRSFLSEANQINARTAELHFAGQGRLVLPFIDLEKLSFEGLGHSERPYAYFNLPYIG